MWCCLSAQDTATPSENAIQLVKLVHCFMSQDAKQDREKFSERVRYHPLDMYLIITHKFKAISKGKLF